MTAISRAFTSIARHRRVLYRTTAVELRRKYAGSVIGPVWVVLGPMLLMLLYVVVYGVIFKLRPAELDSTGYTLSILAGMVAFLGISEGLSNGVSSLTANKDVLLNTVFPAELVPLRAVIVSFASPIVGLIVVLAFDVAVGGLSPCSFLAPLILLLLAMFVVGLAWILALANLVARDVQTLVTYLLMVLLIASPIAFTPSMVPDVIAAVLWFNPLTYFVVALQQVIAFDRVPDLMILGGCLVLGLGTFAFGWGVFERAKKVFFDYA